MSGTKRYYGVFIAFLVFGLMLPQKTLAQTDTTGTAAKTDSIIQYLTPLEYAFMMHEETKFMLRVPIIGIGAEVETLPYLTLMGQFHYRNNHISDGYQFNLNAEMHYYYGSREKGVRNMSGNYIALGYEDRGIFSKIDDKSYYARWGIQRRFIDYGLIDMGVNVGYYSAPRYNYDTQGIRKENGFFIQSTAQVGLGLVFGESKLMDQDKLCPVLKCFEKESFLFKIKTTNLFTAYRSANNNYNEVIIEPGLGIEQKLFDLPLSIGTDLGLFYSWRTDNINKDKYASANYGSLIGRLHARYYYNLKNRVRKGKSGNGLSANYISGGIYEFFSIGESKISSEWTGYFLTTGIQRTFSDHFYFDVEIGFEQNRYNYDKISPVLYGNLQLGIKF